MENAYGSLGITTHTSLPYEAAVERVREALKDEGFGILTEVDVRATLKAKLDVDFRPYVILGACNPPLAHRAFNASAAVGLMLPCNVVVEQAEDGGCIVSALDPDAGLSLLNVPELATVAAEAKERLTRAIAAIG